VGKPDTTFDLAMIEMIQVHNLDTPSNLKSWKTSPLGRYYRTRFQRKERMSLDRKADIEIALMMVLQIQGHMKNN